MNIGTFAGRIGRDAELRTTGAGTSVAGFSLAVDTGYGDKKETVWLDCAVFGKRAEALAAHLTKGKQITVSGPVRLREYTKSDGTKGAGIGLMVNDLTLQGGGSGGQQGGHQPHRQPAPVQEDLDDEVPW